MSRNKAILVLVLFACGALAAAWWGVSDILRWRAAIAGCETPLKLDESSFWMAGSLSIAILPLLALSRAPKVHRVMLIALVAVFLGGPMALHALVKQQAAAQGYNLLALGAFPGTVPVTLHLMGCKRSK